MKKRSLRTVCFVLLLAVPALACNTLTSTPTPMEDATPLPATVLPTPTLVPNELPRWMEYERALASVLLGSVGNTVPDLSRDSGLCEWEVWGQTGEQVYVWAECENDAGAAASAPAVIFLGADGQITSVQMPAEGWGNIEDLFPEPVLTRIVNLEFDAAAALDHIRLRRADPSIPPLIVVQGGVLP